MGMYLGVAECSDHPPKFIHLTYTSPGAAPLAFMHTQHACRAHARGRSGDSPPV